jgi:hypothetical protein
LASRKSSFMGRSNIAITLDLSGHLMPGSEDAAAGLLDEDLAALSVGRAEGAARLAQVSTDGVCVSTTRGRREAAGEIRVATGCVAGNSASAARFRLGAYSLAHEWQADLETAWICGIAVGPGSPASAPPQGQSRAANLQVDLERRVVAEPLVPPCVVVDRCSGAKLL